MQHAPTSPSSTTSPQPARGPWLRATAAIALATASGLFLASCGGGDSNSKKRTPPGTVVQEAQRAGYTSLVSAVQTAGLTATLEGPGPFTVFAPSNSAFAAASGITAGLTPAQLGSVLTYHVLSGRVDSTAALAVATGAGEATTVNGAKVYLDKVGSSLYVNEALAGPLNVPASNGIIHGLDRVLLPPESIYASLTTRGLTSLKGAIDAAADTPVDLVAALQGPGNFTVFAPTNAAFAALGGPALTPAQLQDVLKYHVLGSVVKASGAIAAAGTPVTTLQGQAITTSLDGSTLVINGTAAVTLFNIRATNGIIHVIDAVLIPPAAAVN